MEERNNFMIVVCAEKLAKKLSVDLLKNRCAGIRFRYYKDGEPDDAETANIGLLEVTQDNKGEVTLQVGVSRRGTA